MRSTAMSVLGVDAQHLGAELAPVAELDGHVLGFADDVRVGQDQAVGADDEARAHAAERRRRVLPAARLHAGHAAEELEEGVVLHAVGQAGMSSALAWCMPSTVMPTTAGADCLTMAR